MSEALRTVTCCKIIRVLRRFKWLLPSRWRRILGTEWRLWRETWSRWQYSERGIRKVVAVIIGRIVAAKLPSFMLVMSTTFPPTEPCCSFYCVCDNMPHLTKICDVQRQVLAQCDRGTEEVRCDSAVKTSMYAHKYMDGLLVVIVMHRELKNGDSEAMLRMGFGTFRGNQMMGSSILMPRCSA